MFPKMQKKKKAMPKGAGLRGAPVMPMKKFRAPMAATPMSNGKMC